jgi:alginate O-acetyltransferase complex protein AlgI
MLFTAPVFLFLFLPVVLVVYFVLPRALRNGFLLLASLFFYAWGEGAFVGVMLVSIAVNYGIGSALAGSRRPAALLGLAIAFNLGLLGVFKYADFVAANWNTVAPTLGLPALRLGPLHLPLGISFFTFHALSYLIDVARGAVPAQRDPVRFGLYITLFPQLIAGPIVRYRDIAAQLADREVDVARFASGVRRFVIGLGKKMLIANTVAGPADAIFAMSAGQLTMPLAWLGVVLYALQIYFDFSGYSDMAIGLGRLLGFEFLENFDHPYVARSLTEFWRRWHISLSRWFRDYLYVPLGGNRRRPARVYANLVVVFFLCGLWHGASWTFVVWGLFHGAFLVLERAGLGRVLARVPAVVARLYTLLVVGIAWVWFRAPTLGAALVVLRAMAGLGSAAAGSGHHLALYARSDVVLATVAGIVGAGPALSALERGWAPADAGSPAGEILRPVVRLAGLALVFLASVLAMAANTYDPFIYFRF